MCLDMSTKRFRRKQVPKKATTKKIPGSKKGGNATGFGTSMKLEGVPRESIISVHHWVTIWGATGARRKSGMEGSK